MLLPTVGSITLLLVTNGLLRHCRFFPAFTNSVVQDYKALLTVCFGPSSRQERRDLNPTVHTVLWCGLGFF